MKPNIPLIYHQTEQFFVAWVKLAKKLLRLGNTVNSVREKLCDEETLRSLPDIDENLVTEIVFGNSKKKFQSTTDFNTLSSVTHNQTDPEVLSFIEKLSR